MTNNNTTRTNVSAVWIMHVVSFSVSMNRQKNQKNLEKRKFASIHDVAILKQNNGGTGGRLGI